MYFIFVGMDVNCPSQETEVTLTRPVENVVIKTKGLQDRNNVLLDGRMVENKGKLILNTSPIFTILRRKSAFSIGSVSI